jgi:hypothetical protein
MSSQLSEVYRKRMQSRPTPCRPMRMHGVAARPATVVSEGSGEPGEGRRRGGARTGAQPGKLAGIT